MIFKDIMRIFRNIIGFLIIIIGLVIIFTGIFLLISDTYVGLISIGVGVLLIYLAYIIIPGWKCERNRNLFYRYFYWKGGNQNSSKKVYLGDEMEEMKEEIKKLKRKPIKEKSNILRVRYPYKRKSNRARKKRRK